MRHCKPFWTFLGDCTIHNLSLGNDSVHHYWDCHVCRMGRYEKSYIRFSSINMYVTRSFLCIWKAGTMSTRFTSVSHHWPKSDLETLFLDKGETILPFLPMKKEKRTCEIFLSPVSFSFSTWEREHTKIWRALLFCVFVSSQRVKIQHSRNLCVNSERVNNHREKSVKSGESSKVERVIFKLGN